MIFKKTMGLCQSNWETLSGEGKSYKGGVQQLVSETMGLSGGTSVVRYWERGGNLMGEKGEVNSFLEGLQTVTPSSEELGRRETGKRRENKSVFRQSCRLGPNKGQGGRFFRNL